MVDIASLQSKLDAAVRELDLYKQNDTGALAEKLKAKDEELRVLKLKEEQTAQVCGPVLWISSLIVMRRLRK